MRRKHFLCMLIIVLIIMNLVIISINGSIYKYIIFRCIRKVLFKLEHQFFFSFYSNSQNSGQ